jgi:eukaryotic-like serine/threonine-protein kinase
VTTTNQLQHRLRQDYSGLRDPRRPTGIPTNVLAAQHRIRRDGTQAFAQSSALPFEAGEVVCGKYRIQELIGVGGVGFVVSATHLQLDDEVALKLLKPEFASHPEAVRSFSLEARASFRIRSEHVARVYDVDVLPDGTPFMVMELLRGEDLRTILRRHRVLPIEFAVDLALQTCEALATAHACGIVHRDVKPENLFVTQAGETPHIKVLDFGISQALITSPTRLQGGGMPTTIAVGTPPYMSPEQIRGASDLDGRADVWSLGCVIYELLTGLAPFARMSVMQACAAVLEEEPAPLHESRPDLPPALEQAVMRCLIKDPSLRFADAAELALALAPFGRHSVYYAQRCATLLAKEVVAPSTSPRSSDPPPSAEVLRLRLSTGAQAVRRLPTNTGDVQTAAPRALRRPTLNPVPSSVATPARPGSIEVSAAVVPMPVQAPAPVREISRPSPPPPPPPAAAPVAFAVPAQVAPVAIEPIDEDLDFVPGLRPRKTGWLVFAASVCVAAGLAYLAIVGLDRLGLDRVVPTRTQGKRPPLTHVDTPEPAPVEIPQAAAALH